MLVNGDCSAKTMPDTGCLSYGLVDSRFAQKHNLQRIRIKPRTMTGYNETNEEVVNEVAVIQGDIDGHVERRMFLYVVPQLASYDIILGLPWMNSNDVRISPRSDHLLIKNSGTLVRNRTIQPDKPLKCSMVSAVGFHTLVRRKKKAKEIEVFAASLADIQKALASTTKKRTDPQTKLPKYFHEFLDVFDRTEAEKLPPLRGKGIDHYIEIERKDGQEQEVPWGPLYKMSRDELLVLRRTLTDLLDKQFIRVSNSPAAAPVLFVRKPGGGLRFCVDYRGLNRITRKDRYPLPLIYETLRNIGKARWYTKLDVIAAFHKIRIAEGDEWKTAFRTRYGLFEWMVTPFGLANAPSTFQKYINWALRDYLDEFCSAYVDDVLIYSSGSRKEHQDHVRKVLQRLREAGLQLDIDKCEFEVQSTKYLGFIIEAEKGVRMDPEKVKAILEWQAPKSVKGIQSFIGFANFYRVFIRSFSEIVRPITDLVRKDEKFKWTNEAQAAFEKLKGMFVSAPILVQFDYTRTTILETDSSGWCVGGTLFQEDDNGMLRPCAYFSKKLNPSECNYEIYDKEMLAIVRCLEEWDAELRSVLSFQIRTDHRNLEYFMTVRKLNERQMRWSLVLSKFNFTIMYLPGKKNLMADALSRREQDMPGRLYDERIQHRTMQLLKPETLVKLPKVQAAPVSYVRESSYEGDIFGEATELKALWDEAEVADALYKGLVRAVREQKRTFPSTLGVKVSIGECSLDDDGKLLFRGRRWVPESEPLRTGLIQQTHDSVIAGHPGREVTAALMMRQFFWPGMLAEIRQFVRNCDTCRRNSAWRDRRQGFLKPLPIPDRTWREISIDFVVELPLSKGYTNLVVITDRLGKGVILEPMKEITTEAVADVFVRSFYRYHGLPAAIVSDRGKQFVGHMWSRICKLLKIVRRVSTAYHPETDGSTERMNQTVEAYIRTFTNYAQDNWVTLLPMAELAINNHDSATTGVSPFFLSHGYNVEPLQLSDEDLKLVRNKRSPIQQANDIVRKLKEATEWAQTAMAIAQQVQEDTTNRQRDQAPQYKVGDKVWLNLANVRTDRPSKKLDAKNAKYTIIESIGSHSFRLDTPQGIHNVFHSKLLRPAADDPLPSQRTTDPQPAPRIVNNEEEYEVEGILKERLVRKGRGRTKQYLVKWVGYDRPTWEPASEFEDVEALDAYEEGRKGVM
jgi:hypothetical protein